MFEPVCVASSFLLPKTVHTPSLRLSVHQTIFTVLGNQFQRLFNHTHPYGPKCACLELMIDHQSNVRALRGIFSSSDSYSRNSPSATKFCVIHPESMASARIAFEKNLPITASLWISTFPSEAHQSPKPNCLRLSLHSQEETASMKMPETFCLAIADVRQEYNYLTLSTPFAYSIPF